MSKKGENMKSLNNPERHLEYLLIVSVITLLCVVTLTLSGCAGSTGPQGAQGLQGIQGPSVAVSTQPASVSECLNGGVEVTVGLSVTAICNGEQGAAGNTGATGDNGQNGANGSNGTNGSSVVPIQFCPGQSSYPSNFPESGLIINGVIYGVYSLNNGFLAQLPPGQYASNVIGSSCTFTINPDNTISH